MFFMTPLFFLSWDDFTHDQAVYRAYRWGEDGLLGISDEQCRLCLALALWNGKDPILKERLYGLTNSQVNMPYIGKVTILCLLPGVWVKMVSWEPEMNSVDFLALTLWNGKDLTLKERLYGLTNSQVIMSYIGKVTILCLLPGVGVRMDFWEPDMNSVDCLALTLWNGKDPTLTERLPTSSQVISSPEPKAHG